MIFLSLSLSRQVKPNQGKRRKYDISKTDSLSTKAAETNNINISIRNWHTYELHTYLSQALRYYEFKHKFAADELVLG